MDKARDRLKRGHYVAGWLSYEAGLAFEARAAARASRTDADRFPLLWFGAFGPPAMLTGGEVGAALPDPDGAWVSPPRPRMSKDDYFTAFASTMERIIGGDIYQLNLSYRADVTVLGHPLAAYAKLRSAGQGGYSGVVHDGAHWLVSTSPELFFEVKNGAIEARPMKGTAARHPEQDEDRRAAQNLQTDPKQLAENLMIVDLLRNDMSRIAKSRSVHVPKLFSVETYPTLHTLTSTIRAAIREGLDIVDVLGALFPCGSITGAPKIRAMEIIAEVETDRRGPYTGTIGWMSPDGDAAFNVAIRTLAIGPDRAEVGLGSAVVFDSTAEGEWEECALKGRFLTANTPNFTLLETMGFQPNRGITRLDLHLARLRSSAQTLGFVFEERVIRAKLSAAHAHLTTPHVLRLSLTKDGEAVIEVKIPPPPFDGPIDVALAPLPVASDDFRLRHKTSLRDFYDAARTQSGADEIVFLDRDGFVTEGSFTSVFVPRGAGLTTPPLRRGVLPGVLRAALLASGGVSEEDLRREDLEQPFFVGNAVRGLMSARALRG
jgi:para-aminobenzoate synthetase / 4-amino-4-deoxychorismate lyase